jgi:mono/diheme cytochrome c family protein
MAATLLLAAAGCGGGATDGKSAAQPQVSATDRAEADEIFAKRCAACHGTSGMGDGPGALALSPKPRNYRDRAWQKNVTDEEIEKAIVYGGAAVGKSPQMVANPDLQAKPGVVTALRVKIREFGRP